MHYLGCIALLMLVPSTSFADKDQKIGGKTVAQWLVQLQSKDAKLQLQAAQFLGDFGPDAADAVGPLATLLKADDKNLRVQVVAALGRIGPGAKAAIPQLLTALKDTNPEVGVRAIVALGNMGPAAQDALPALIALARVRDKDRALAAVAALGRIGIADKDAVAVLVETLGDPDIDLAARAAQALVDMEAGQEAVRAAVVQALNHKSARVFAVPLWSVRRWHEAGPIPPGTKEALLNLLLRRKEAEGIHRLWAAQAVGFLLEPADLAGFRAALQDRDPLVRLQAAAMLTERTKGDELKDMLPVLLRGLKHEEAAVRSYAVKCLQANVPPADLASDVIAALQKATLDPSPLVRREAAVALVRLTGVAKEGMPVLLALLAEPRLKERAEAARALGKLGKKAGEALEPLLDIFSKDKSKDEPGKDKEISALVRASAADALGRMGALGKKGADVLHDVVINHKEQRSTRVEAAIALVRLGLGGPEEVLELQFALSGRDPALCALGIQRVSDLTAKQAAEIVVPALRELLVHPEPQLRHASWYALQHLDHRKPRRIG
jgi:HEAT repeat protein